MRILMTGMSTRTVGSTRLRLDYLNFNPLLKKALETLGHSVDQRRVALNEDFKDYDLAFVHVNPGDKIVCQNVLEVCTVLAEMGDRAIVFLEDWVSVEFKNAWSHVLNVRWEKWKRWKGYGWDEDQDALVRGVIQQIIDGRWPIVANFYGWGDPSRFFADNFNTDRCAILDPSSMAVVPPFTQGPRVRRWVLATLQKHDQWTARQGFTWSVETYGNARQGQPVITEVEVTQRYAWSWGVLAPRYPVLGWFRPRFLLAAATGTPLFCDPAEGKLLGFPYVLQRSQVEQMTDLELTELAKHQAQVFNQKIWSRERLLDELSGLLRGVTA